MKMLKVYAEVIHSAVVQSSFIISGYVGSSSSHICVPFLPFFFNENLAHPESRYMKTGCGVLQQQLQDVMMLIRVTH
jgi:hypothetical protein